MHSRWTKRRTVVHDGLERDDDEFEIRCIAAKFWLSHTCFETSATPDSTGVVLLVDPFFFQRVRYDQANLHPDYLYRDEAQKHALI